MAGSTGTEHEPSDVSWHVDPTGGGIFLLLAMLLGIGGRAMSRKLPIPYTVLLLIVGGILGVIHHNTNSGYVKGQLSMNVLYLCVQEPPRAVERRHWNMGKHQSPFDSLHIFATPHLWQCVFSWYVLSICSAVYLL